jgi:hypothetical protein
MSVKVKVMTERLKVKAGRKRKPVSPKVGLMLKVKRKNGVKEKRKWQVVTSPRRMTTRRVTLMTQTWREGVISCAPPVVPRLPFQRVEWQLCRYRGCYWCHRTYK